jgi:hypothetical protein
VVSLESDSEDESTRAQKVLIEYCNHAPISVAEQSPRAEDSKKDEAENEEVHLKFADTNSARVILQVWLP